MAVYNVYLVDILDSLGGPTRRTEVAAVLQTYFARIASKAGIKEGASVKFVEANPQLAPDELLCYFYKGRHIVGMMDGAAEPDSEGWTHSANQQTGSDVKADGVRSTRAYANLAFHEFMHNKCALSDEQLHKLGGLASDTVNENTMITPANIELMAKNLKQKRAQWTRGIELMIMKKTNDPLGEL